MTYPRHHPQDSVRLPDESLGVKGSSSLTSSIRASLHTGNLQDVSAGSSGQMPLQGCWLGGGDERLIR